MGSSLAALKARRFVAVEMAVGGDFVADLGLGRVDPRIGHVRHYFAGKVLLNVLGQWDILGVAQSGVGFGVALGVGHQGGSVVVFADCRPDRLDKRGRRFRQSSLA
jgi:hypothetical protein